MHLLGMNLIRAFFLIILVVGYCCCNGDQEQEIKEPPPTFRDPDNAVDKGPRSIARSFSVLEAAQNQAKMSAGEWLCILAW